MLGYSSSEMIGQTPERLQDKAESAEYASYLSVEFGEKIQPGIPAFIALTVRGMSNKHECTFIRKDGTRLPVYVTITAWRCKKNIIKGFLCMAMDISQQQQDRLELQLLTEHLNKAVQVADLGTWSWNVHDNTRIWSDRMKEMYSVPHDANPDSFRDYWMSSLHPEDYFEALNELQRATDGIEPYNSIFRMIKEDGSIRYMQAEGVMELDKDGKPLFMSGFNRDITEQIEREATLRNAMANANAANLAKSTFLANMSHEIRTPMNAILGMQQLLHRTTLDARQLDYVAKTETAAQALLAILNDILDFSKVEAGKLLLDIHVFNFDKLLRDIGAILAANIGSKEVEVLFDIDPDVPSWFLGDALRLQQILINIAGNAIKFTSVGEIVLTIRLIKNEATTREPELHISVRDTGIGIAPEAQKYIFDGFSQAESSTARRFGGSGLGLAISQRLVRLMGGEIGLESVVGVGTTFHFTIPCTSAEVPEIPSVTAVADLKVLRVLIIDDNQQSRQILASNVDQFGWSADQSESGEEALIKVRNAKKMGIHYDLILVDWLMPHMDGWETTDHISQLYADSIAPKIIMVTAADRSKTLEQHVQLSTQLDGFLVKPITASMLFDVVVDACNGHNKELKLQTPKISSQRLQGIRILVVEDNATNQQVARELLSAEGAIVTVSDNGHEAIEAVSKIKLDIILLDIQMPDMDGYTVAREIRKHFAKDILPIIALTANALETDRTSAISAGMNDHVGKPFDLTQLVSVILNHLDKVTKTQTDELNQIVHKNESRSLILDDQSALNRFGGNKKIYGNALIIFSKDISQFMIQLKQLMTEINTNYTIDPIRTSKQVTLKQVLHSLKGISGTIGAVALYDLVTKLELSSIEEFAENWFEFKLLIIQTLKHVELVALQLNNEQPHLEKSASIKTDHKKRPLISEIELLSKLLRDSNMDALNVFERLKLNYSEIYPNELKDLTLAMDQLNFIDSLSFCEDLLTLWENQKND
jgi:two-component system sensor histidine kinase/response regulator